MKKRILSFLLTAIMILTMMPIFSVPAFAADPDGKIDRTNIPSVTMYDYEYGKTTFCMLSFMPTEFPKITYYYNTSNSTDGATEWSPSNSQTIDAGTYYFFAEIGETATYKKCYTDLVTFTVRKGEYTVTAPSPITGLTFDGNIKTLVLPGSVSDHTIAYRVGTEGSFSSELPKKIDAGTYDIYYKVEADNNYKEYASTTPVTVTISKANWDVTEPTAKTGLISDETPLELVTAGIVKDVNGEICAGKMLYSLTGNDNDYSTDIPTGIDAGEYKVYYKVVGEQNYNEEPADYLSVTIGQKPKPDSCVVTFNTNGHGKVDTQVLDKGEKATKPQNPSDEGWTFEGWYSDSELTKTFDFDSPIMADTTVFAKWEKIHNYKITASSDKSVYDEGELITLTATVLDGNTPVDNEYVVFSVNGMKIAVATDNGSCSISKGLPAGTYTISACYKKDGDEYKDTVEVTVKEQPNENHIVKFDLNNDKTDGPTPQEIKHGEKATKPADPSDEGWIFEGWYSDAELTKEYDFNAPIMADIKLFAKWTEDKLPTPPNPDPDPNPEPKPVEVYYAPLVADLKANEEGVIEWEAGDSLPLEAVKLLVDKPELSLEFTFTYEGEEHTIFIPAGAFEKYYDVTIPWYGPAWLIQYFEKSEKEVIEYTIVSGDTLNALAEKYKCTVEEILALNPYINDKHWIFPNNKLLIPVQK